MFSAADHEYMGLALRLAARGLATTTPNPRVGCVIVDGEGIAGEGWHRRAGEGHAEVEALRSAAGRARGATAYVTLEPCNHHGRTPPCTEALLAAGIRRVVAAMEDPNPRVAGSGFRRLQEAGIEVAAGLMAAEARELNIGFVWRMSVGRPWVRLKIAASLDGRVALANGVSQWITGPDARRDGHGWRARSCAVLTGVGTVKTDNPRLTVRDVPCTRQPLRVVIDSRLETPPTAALLEHGGVLIFAADDGGSGSGRAQALRAAGAEIVCLPNLQGKVDLPAMLAELARRGINEVLAEAGSQLNGSLLRENCADELLVYLAPMMLGADAQAMVGITGLAALDQALRPRIMDQRRVGADLRLLLRLS